jgi:hypothetical protein
MSGAERTGNCPFNVRGDQQRTQGRERAAQLRKENLKSAKSPGSEK